MLTQVRLQNFQSHEDTTLELAEGLTAVTGPSHCGKTAFWRAMRLLARNKPSNANASVFIRHGAPSYKIVMTLDGREISKERGGKINRYEIDGEKYDTVGKDVPAAIDELLGGDVFECANVEYDFSFLGQFEGSFLIFAPDGVKSKAIGKLSGMEIFDEAVKMANTEAAEAGRQQQSAITAVAEVQEKLVAFAGMDAAAALHAGLQQQFDDLHVLELKLPKLRMLTEERDRLLRSLQKNDQPATEAFNLAHNHLSDLETAQRKIQKLRQLLETWQKATKTLGRKSTTANDLAISAVDVLGLVEAAGAKLAKLNGLRSTLQVATRRLKQGGTAAVAQRLLDRAEENAVKLTQGAQIMSFAPTVVPVIQRHARAQDLIQRIHHNVPIINSIKDTGQTISSLENDARGRLSDLLALINQRDEVRQQISAAEGRRVTANREESQIKREVQEFFDGLPRCESCKQVEVGFDPEHLMA